MAVREREVAVVHGDITSPLTIEDKRAALNALYESAHWADAPGEIRQIIEGLPLDQFHAFLLAFKGADSLEEILERARELSLNRPKI